MGTDLPALEKLTSIKSATITLGNLERLCSAADYAALVAEIGALVAGGAIKPMGRDTNGKVPPLHSKYRIIRNKQHLADLRAEIMRLGPEFNPSGYLRNLPTYEKHSKLLHKLIAYTRTNGAELESSMSRNERAYAIWGNEKQLEDPTCKNMLRFTGWAGRLNCYDTPEPFMDYLPRGTDTKSILILENKDIWFSLRKIFMENRDGCFLYGERFDGLLYGEGKKVTRANAISEYSNEGFRACPSFAYWGDLDCEGISIYQRLAVQHRATPRKIRLFVPGYLAMLEYARAGESYTQCRGEQAQPYRLEDFLSNFDPAAAAEIRSILGSGMYIPQEICNYPRLMRSATAN